MLRPLSDLVDSRQIDVAPTKPEGLAATTSRQCEEGKHGTEAVILDPVKESATS